MELENGIRERIYQRALEIELKEAGIRFVHEFEMGIFYKGTVIGGRRVDFLVEGKVMES